MAAAMQRKIVDGVRITPNEVKTFFDRIPKDSLPFFESELEVGQIVVFPKASKDLEDYIVSEMNNYKKQLESKSADFCRLAKQVSEDPGSKDRCGQYKMNNKKFPDHLSRIEMDLFTSQVINWIRTWYCCLVK